MAEERCEALLSVNLSFRASKMYFSPRKDLAMLLWCFYLNDYNIQYVLDANSQNTPGDQWRSSQVSIEVFNCGSLQLCRRDVLVLNSFSRLTFESAQKFAVVFPSFFLGWNMLGSCWKGILGWVEVKLFGFTLNRCDQGLWAVVVVSKRPPVRFFSPCWILPQCHEIHLWAASTALPSGVCSRHSNCSSKGILMFICLLMPMHYFQSNGCFYVNLRLVVNPRSLCVSNWCTSVLCLFILLSFTFAPFHSAVRP